MSRTVRLGSRRVQNSYVWGSIVMSVGGLVSLAIIPTVSLILGLGAIAVGVAGLWQSRSDPPNRTRALVGMVLAVLVLSTVAYLALGSSTKTRSGTAQSMGTNSVVVR